MFPSPRKHDGEGGKMKAEGGIWVNPCASVDCLSADFKNRYQLGPLKMTEVECGQRFTTPGKTEVEHVPLKTYDLTFAGRIANASQQMGCRVFERGKFRKVS